METAGDRLTVPEREVVKLLVEGMKCKKVASAYQYGICEFGTLEM